MKAPHPNFVQRDECPMCFTLLDHAAGNNAKPSVSDFSICIKCASILRFDERLILRATDDNDLKDIDAQGRRYLTAGQAAIRERNKSKGLV